MKTVVASPQMQSELDAIIDEAASLLITPIPSGSFTLAQFMARTGMNRNSAREGLNRLVAEGKMQTVKVRVGGHNVCVWSPIQKKG